VFQVLADMSGDTLESTEGTWNLGIGMFGVVRADAASAVISALAAQGISAWVAGMVSMTPRDLAGFEQGAKGVDGGAVRLVGTYGV
jgi:phosphoribosylformylglycinamidine cyclo-ligase